VVLILIIIAKLFEKNNYTDIAHFLEINQKNLIYSLQLSVKRMPSLSTIRRVLMTVDMAQLMLIANEWMWLTYPGKNEDDWVSLDGKKLRNTETDNKKSVSIQPSAISFQHCSLYQMFRISAPAKS
jgi:hypothetical protein